MLGPWYPTPPAPCGAAERLWYHLAFAFAERAHKVAVLSRASVELPKDEIKDGVQFIRRTQFHMRQRRMHDLSSDLIYTLRMLPQIPACDVLVTNNVWMPLITSRLPTKYRIVQNVARMPKGQMKWYLKCGRLSAVSQAVAREIIRQCPQAKRIVTVVPNPIDTTAFFRRENPAKGNGRTILYTGRITPEKGLEILIDATRHLLARFSDIRLHIVGPQEIADGGGGHGYVASLRKRIGDAPIDILPPEFDRTRLADIYRSANVYVYPSIAERGESFGVAPLEAMACGIPTIVSKLECFAEFMIDGTTGLVFDHRSDEPAAALSECLTAILGSEATAKRLGDAGAIRAKQFSYSAIAGQYLEDWQRMLNGLPGIIESVSSQALDPH